MRGRAIAVVWFGLIGCGRIGYEDIGAIDATPAIDAADAPEPGLLAECNVAVELVELPVPPTKTVTGLEVGATASGVIVVWSIESGVWTTAFNVSATHRFVVTQGGAEVTDFGTSDVAIGAVGDDAVLAVSHHAENDIFFHPLGATGEGRASVKVVESVHAHGNEYLVADPSDRVFGIAGTNVGTTVTLEREIDSHPETDPVAAFPAILAEATGITKLGDGYAVISGRPTACDIIAIDGGANPLGTAQRVAATCLHPTIANPVSSAHVIAAWNCDCHQVWVTGGPLSADLPEPRAIYGDDASSASNPRLAPTSAGVWYGFEVAGGRLGRALVDLHGAAVESVATEIVVDSGAGDYDLVSHADQAYLFWTVPDEATTALWTMRLCP